MARFSKYMPSSDGYYPTATRGLGSRCGFAATRSYLAYGLLGPTATIGFHGYMLSDMLETGR